MPFLHLALLLLVVGVWGFNFVVIKVGLEGIPPLFLCFARFLLTSIPAIFFIKKPEAPFKMVALYGLILFALQFGLLFFAIYAGVSAGMAAILLQLHVFFSIPLAALFFGEKLRIWTVAGAAVSFSGIGLVGMNLGGEITLSGLMLCILAAFFWGSGSVIAKKIGKVNMISLVVWGAFLAWPPLFLASYLMEGKEQILSSLQNITWTGIGAVFYIAYLATILGFGVWGWLLQYHPLTKVAPFTLLVPFLAMISSALVLGEPLQSWKILAGALVIGGLCINLAGAKAFDAMKRRRVEG